MVSTEFKGAGLHYTAFRDAIREDSRQITPSRGVSPRKKFAVKANVESRVKTLVDTAEPDLKVIKEEYAQEASVWAERNRLLLPFAQAMMAYMGLCRINQPTRLTTLDKVLENQAQMVSGEYRHTHQ